MYKKGDKVRVFMVSNWYDKSIPRGVLGEVARDEISGSILVNIPGFTNGVEVYPEQLRLVRKAEKVNPIPSFERDYIDIRLQNGPIKEVGVNGCQIDDVIQWCVDCVKEFNKDPFKCRENSLVITKLEEALHWLEHRKKNREQRGVEGTFKP